MRFAAVLDGTTGHRGAAGAALAGFLRAGLTGDLSEDLGPGDPGLLRRRNATRTGLVALSPTRDVRLVRTALVAARPHGGRPGGIGGGRRVPGER